MVDRIHGLPPLEPPRGPNQDLRKAAQDLRAQIDIFTKDLKKLLQEPHLSQDRSFLSEVRNHLLSLHQSVETLHIR